jgi:hypothetical protein
MLKTRSFLICTFLCAILSTGRAVASDYYSNALRIFSEGRLFLASIEFERAIFYETDNNNIAKCKYYKALCYKGLGETVRALEELSEINPAGLSDSLFFMVHYEQAFCNYLNKDPDQSLWNFDEIRFRFPDSMKTYDIIPLNILCLNDKRKWDDALILWNYFIDNSGLADTIKSDIKSEVNKLYDERNIPKLHSPQKAENLSRFIPGSGQIYCGHFLEGSFNFLMNSTILGFSLYEFLTKYYFTGYIVGLSLFNKTYHGGMNRAKLLAGEKNIADMNRLNLDASTLMIRVIGIGQSENRLITTSLNMQLNVR